MSRRCVGLPRLCVFAHVAKTSVHVQVREGRLAFNKEDSIVLEFA